MINPLGPIAGVSEELIRALNDRFRQITASTGATATAGARVTRIKDFPAAKQNPGDFFVEMDRGNALYQIQAGRWLLVSGFMAGTLAKRPSEMNSGDVGFLYRATDTCQDFRWSGSAWVDLTTPENEAQIAYGTVDLTLTTTYQDITGVTLTLNRAGRYLIHGVTYLAGVADIGQYLTAQMVADGVAQAELIVLFQGGANQQATVSQQWIYTPATSGKVVKLQARKNVGPGGTSIVSAAHTSISALWLGS